MVSIALGKKDLMQCSEVLSLTVKKASFLIATVTRNNKEAMLKCDQLVAF